MNSFQASYLTVGGVQTAAREIDCKVNSLKVLYNLLNKLHCILKDSGPNKMKQLKTALTGA